MVIGTSMSATQLVTCPKVEGPSEVRTLIGLYFADSLVMPSLTISWTARFVTAMTEKKAIEGPVVICELLLSIEELTDGATLVLCGNFENQEAEVPLTVYPITIIQSVSFLYLIGRALKETGMDTTSFLIEDSTSKGLLKRKVSRRS